MNARANAALSKYQNVSAATGVTDATPHRLIQMLMEGALARIAAARGHMVHGDPAARGEQIGWAISIISGLQACLDMEQGGEISHNLDALYDYMVRRLGEASANNDPSILDEVAGLLGEIKSAWDQLPARLAQEQRRAAAS